MECKKCGHVLPKVGFNCTNCGTMMSAEQIKEQKDNMELNKKLNVELVSEKYGHKNFIYQKRDKDNFSYWWLILLIGIIILIFLIASMVFF